jgi:hypothetical protein
MPILTRIARIMSQSPNTLTMPPQPTDDLANHLLHAVEAVVAAGLDPERELERAFRERSRDGIVSG